MSSAEDVSEHRDHRGSLVWHAGGSTTQPSSAMTKNPASADLNFDRSHGMRHLDWAGMLNLSAAQRIRCLLSRAHSLPRRRAFVDCEIHGWSRVLGCWLGRDQLLSVHHFDGLTDTHRNSRNPWTDSCVQESSDTAPG